MTNAGKRLRELLNNSGLLVIPGAYDALSAKLVQLAGFQAVYMTGAGTAAGYGYPDYGLLTMTEMVENARRIVAAVDVPVIADADTGYGNPLNVYRTVQEYGRAGVAGIHIEDQVFPKRCGHLDRKQVIPTSDFLAKIRAAAEARPDPDFVLIARTDAIAVNGIDDAIDRARRSLEAGADIAFVEAPESVDHLRRIAREVPGPKVFNAVPSGKTPPLSIDQVEALGFKVAIFPSATFGAAVQAMQQALRNLKESGQLPRWDVEAQGPRGVFELVGLKVWQERERRYVQV